MLMFSRLVSFIVVSIITGGCVFIVGCFVFVGLGEESIVLSSSPCGSCERNRSLLFMIIQMVYYSLTGSGAFKHDCIKVLPSGLVTIGCNFGVVNVYTKPVSDTINSNT